MQIEIQVKTMTTSQMAAQLSYLAAKPQQFKLTKRRRIECEICGNSDPAYDIRLANFYTIGKHVGDFIQLDMYHCNNVMCSMSAKKSILGYLDNHCFLGFENAKITVKIPDTTSMGQLVFAFRDVDYSAEPESSFTASERLLGLVKNYHVALVYADPHTKVSNSTQKNTLLKTTTLFALLQANSNDSTLLNHLQSIEPEQPEFFDPRMTAQCLDDWRKLVAAYRILTDQ